MRRITLYLPLLLIIFGALVRLLWLGSIPSGFFRDEAALGYNAYSIWETGRDEFGERMPLIFRSFEVFFLPLYVYLSAPIVGILGLSEFSTRLLSSISGIVAIISIFLIVKEIWNRKAGIFAVLLLSVSPWHIFYSRGAFEGNLALTLFTLGFLFFVYFLKNKKTLNLFCTILFFSLSMYSYQSERVVVPLFLLASLFMLWKKLWVIRKKFLIPLVAAIIILAPLISFSFKTAGFHRALGVSIFTAKPPGLSEEANSKILNNQIFLRSKQIISLYVSYYSPRNLFIEGDYDKQRSTNYFSVFYSWMSLFFLSGLWFSLKKTNTYVKLLLVWIILAPIPAALTGDPFHTYRSLLLYLPLTILMAIGWESLVARINYGRLLNYFVVIVAFISLSYFLYDYAVITPATRARNWDYGYREIVSFIMSNSFSRVVVHDRWTEPYVHFLFYTKMNPKIYHDAVFSLKAPYGYYYLDGNEIRPEKVLNYEFRLVDWPNERGDSGTVFVFDANDLPDSEFKGDPKIELLKEIRSPIGEVAYRIVKIK